MKKSVQKKQNTFSQKTAEKGSIPCGQNNHGSQRVYPVPGYLKNLGIETPWVDAGGIQPGEPEGHAATVLEA